MSFTFVLATLWVLEGSNFISAMQFLFSKKNIVVYDTYTVSFDNSVSKGYRDIIVENLEKLEFGERKDLK